MPLLTLAGPAVMQYELTDCLMPIVKLKDCICRGEPQPGNSIQDGQIWTLQLSPGPTVSLIYRQIPTESGLILRLGILRMSQSGELR